MEIKGLVRCLGFVTEQGLTIKTLITDRHIPIRKYMREKQPAVGHMLDGWHVRKGWYPAA